MIQSILCSQFQPEAGVPSALLWLAQDSTNSKTCPLFRGTSVKKYPFPPIKLSSSAPGLQISWPRRCQEHSITSHAAFKPGSGQELELFYQIWQKRWCPSELCFVIREIKRGWIETKNSAIKSDMKMWKERKNAICDVLFQIPLQARNKELRGGFRLLHFFADNTLWLSTGRHNIALKIALCSLGPG